MALQLAQKGFDVILTYKDNREGAENTLREIRQLGRKAEAIPMDLSQFSKLPPFVNELKEVLSRAWGESKLHALVNNAGMGKTVPFAEVTENLFDDFLLVHFKSVYFLTQYCVPLICEGGRIINISSGSTVRCVPGYSVYASMKGGIEIFTRYLAKELGARKITANVVAPGPIETDFNNAAIRNNPQMKSHLSQLSPLGRVGEATDIGGVVAFLCTEEARWINGQRLEVAGGLTL
jgi:NAD(P)-dependent dehydrogenase (short-subunit alcohol dehydrogenase family)